MHTMFCLVNLKGIDHLENLGVDGKIILEWNYGNWVGCIHVAQCRNQWQTLVNTVMNLPIP
jgi:hypothetical protein